ncbi:DUF1080 domain-containing protein [Algibacter sp. Ld11]|uniref:3-keto-disaccharide hydrolase n=1 Tax=Algibacter sp. Ld11 TaxID=649150 RepID=UPI003864FBAC
MFKTSKLNNTVFFIALTLSFISCGNINKPNSKEWQTLFNGKNLNGWVVKLNHHELGDNYANTFRVVNNVIQVNYDGYSEFGERFGHLFYQIPFSAYHLKFEYRFTEQWMDEAPSHAYRNSGIMFHSQNPKTILKDQKWPIAVEFQFLAEEKEGEPRSTGNACSPGTHIYKDGVLLKPHVTKSTAKNYKWHQWIKGELIVDKQSNITHIIEGDTVLQYSNPIIGGRSIEGSNPDLQIDGKAITSGFIGLQAEGQGVEFRSITIKDLMQ